MDKNNNSYFYLGGIYSTFMFLLVIAFFAYTIYSSQKISTFALNKDNSINVSIVADSPTKNENKKRVEQKKEENTPVEEKPVEEKPIEKEAKQVVKENVSSLFSNVSTKPIDHVKSEVSPQIDSKKLQALTKKINVAKQNDVVSMKQIIDNTKFAKSTVKVTSQSASTGQEVNKYLAKIQGQIYDNFFPPLNTQGQTSKVLLRLDADGHVLDFKIISYSGSDLFNAEVDRLKKRIALQKFPQNPNGVSGNYMITLVAKE